MRVMYDACNYLRPPPNAAMVAGYVSGGCQWPAAGWRRWSSVRSVRIATGVTVTAGAVLDVERGDATPDQAPQWCAQARLRGQIPTVYTSSSNVDAVLAACKLHDVPAPLIWVALWDGVAEVPPGCIAKQHTNDNAAGYDVSAVADYWPGVDPAPTPSPIPTEEETMWMWQLTEGTIYLMGVGVKVAMLKVADVDVYIAQGVKLTHETQFTAEWNAALLAWPTVPVAGG